MSAAVKTSSGHDKLLLFFCAAAIRVGLAIAFPGLPDLLTGRVEVSTPVNSFKRRMSMSSPNQWSPAEDRANSEDSYIVQEGLFLYDHGLDPYDGGIFHQAPLLLPLFSLLPSRATALGRLVSVLLYTSLDVLIASNLYDIAASGAPHTSRLYVSPRKVRSWQPTSVVATYLFNPYTLLTCLGRPTSVFAIFFATLGIKEACHAKQTTAAFALAIASYISLHPVLLLPPVGLVCYDRLCLQTAGSEVSDEKTGPGRQVAVDASKQPSGLTFGITLFGIFAASVAFLFALSRLLLPSWNFIPAVYLTPLTLPDLTPNPGLWWYFFIEQFDAFRSFFLGVFWLHMLSYSVPFCLRFRKQPLAAVVCMMGVIAIFEPYANIGNVGVWLSSLTLLSHTFERKYSTNRFSGVTLTMNSGVNPSVYIPRAGGIALHDIARAGVPSLMDIRGQRKRQLLLCHHARVGTSSTNLDDGHGLLCVEGRVGGRKTRGQGQRGPPDIIEGIIQQRNAPAPC